MSSSLGIAGSDGAILWTGTSPPTWQKDAEKTTRLYITLHPSTPSTYTFLPETETLSGIPTNTGSIPRPMSGSEIQGLGLGYGFFVQPKKQSGFKKLVSKGGEVEPTLWTVEKTEGDVEAKVKVRKGPYVGVHGHLVRFLIGQYGKDEDVLGLVRRIDTVLKDEDSVRTAGSREWMARSVRRMQEGVLIDKWDVAQFLEVMDTVVSQVKEEGTQGTKVTTVDYLAHVSGGRK